MVDFRGEPFEEPGHQDFVTEEIHPVAENREHTNSVDALAANPTNRAIYASGSHDYNIKLWDGNSGQCIKTMRGHQGGVWHMNYMTDGRKLISASVDGTAKIWDTNNGQVIDTLQGVHDFKVYNVAVNDAMTQAVTCGGSDKKIVLWDLRNTRQPLFVNTDSQSSVISCDFSNDQNSIITGNLGGRINIIDLQTREWRVDYDTLVL